MIDPSNITNYDATEKELEELILFWVCAAGKNGHTSAKCLDKFLSSISIYGDGPFQSIFGYILVNPIMKTEPIFEEKLKQCGIGCYTSKAKTIKELVLSDINLRECTVEELEKIYGIGRKTARCFIIHSRKDARYAGVDTHILKFLRTQGVENVPKSTPSSKKEYERLEKEFLKFVDKSNKTVAEFDLEVWNSYAVTPKGL